MCDNNKFPSSLVFQALRIYSTKADMAQGLGWEVVQFWLILKNLFNQNIVYLY